MAGPASSGLKTKHGAKPALSAGRSCASPYLKMTALFLAAAAVIVIGMHIAAGVVLHSMAEPSYETVVVRRGDTLWDIARRVNPGTDPRKTIYEIKKLNQLDSVNLQPGQILLIPLAAICRE